MHQPRPTHPVSSRLRAGRGSFFALLLAVLPASILLPAPEVAAQGSAQRYLQQQNEEVHRILRQSATSDAARQRRSERLTRLLNGLLDYESLSQSALGTHWEARSPEERTHFVNLLRQLVERNYQTNLEHILDYEIGYEEDQRRGENTIVVTSARSRAQRRQPAVEIEYTLHHTGGQWSVIDVRTDGVSMVDNYRSQFERIIARDGWGELISRMERRLQEGTDS